MKWIASAAFGLEGMTGRDLKRLGAQNVRVTDVGGAMFEGDFETAFQANLWSVSYTHLDVYKRQSLVNVDYDIEAFNNAAYGAFIMENLAQAMGGEGVYTCLLYTSRCV